MMIRARTQALAASALLVLVAASTASEPLPRRGLMGIMIQEINTQMKRQLGLPSTDGVVITGTPRPDSPAAEAGLESNDVIVKIGDATCASIADLRSRMREYYAGDTVTLTILRSGKKMTVDLKLMERPREESDQYDILYDSVAVRGRRARTIITRPKGADKSPAVLFIQGLSGQSVEVGMFPQHPYKSLVGGLDEAGFVTMRVERLGVGDSEGKDVNTTTVQDDVQCFRAGLAKLSTYDFVDPKRVFIFSHSTGSAIAPMVAAESDASGVIAWAPLANPVTTVLPELVKKRWELEVREDDEIERNVPKIETFVKQCLILGNAPAEVFQSHPEVKDVVQPLMQDDETLLGAHYRYWQQIAVLDLPKEWSRVDTDVLALWGTSDYNAARGCSELIARTVNKMHPGKATCEAIPGVDHMWQPAEDMEESFLMGFTGEFSPKVIETVTGWMRSVS
jgi:alpha-beta hydrolase superfamily lysophospholipase